MTQVDEVFEDGFFAALYDDFNPWMACDDFYLARAREAGGPILDIGCGTGMLACRIAAAGLDITGADPADGMLQVARNRAGSDKVTWIESDGQSLDLERRFSLIYMTGHAFQALLTDADAVAVLRNAGRHLEAAGRFIFETRNPAARIWERWTPEQSRRMANTVRHGRVEESYGPELSYNPDTGIADLVHVYRLLDKGEQRVGYSKLRFITYEHLAHLVAEAGLWLETCYGNWQQEAFQADSPEIIAVVRRKPA